MRYFVFFAYNGSAYHGWQFQPNASSVQQEMENAFSTVLRTPVTLVAAGRTDTGVHARLMAAHFDLPDSLVDSPSPSIAEGDAVAQGLSSRDRATHFSGAGGRAQRGARRTIPGLNLGGAKRSALDDLAFRLNGFLPADITIHRIVPVQPDAHARFDALSRTYEYWITDVKNPFTDRLITYTRFRLDFDLMNEAAKILLEEKDFASFCKAHSDNKTTLCDVRRAFWEPRPLPFLPPTTQNSHPHGSFTNLHTLNLPTENVAHVFTIESDRFLRNMVRAVVGTLFEVGRGAMSVSEMRDAVHAHNRCAAGQSMPPDGLYLTDIRYPDRIFL